MSAKIVTIPPVAEGHMAAIVHGLELRILFCQTQLNDLVDSGSGKTAIADHWRNQELFAEQALELVRRAA